MDKALLKRISEPLEKRSSDQEERFLNLFNPASDIINLSNNDYLDLANSDRLKKAAQEAIEKYGCSSSASPLISGFMQPHHELENLLKDWYQASHAMIWNTGYAANQAVLSLLPQKGDIILADRLIHNSMIRGILHSGARLIRYRHCDTEHLKSLLEEHSKNDKSILVVTESVFSMDGDYPDLKAFAELKENYDFTWILDEAHAIGWYGKEGSGFAEESSVLNQVDILVGTLGKGLASMGAFTIFHEELLKRYFINYAGEFIYSTYLAPACAAAATEAIKIIRETDRRDALQKMSSDFRAKLKSIDYESPNGDSPIIPIILNDSDKTLKIAAELKEAGILVAAVRPPTVPEGTARLRVSLNASFDEEKQSKFIEILKSCR